MVKKQIKQSDLQKIADEIDNIGKENEAGHRKVIQTVASPSKHTNEIYKKIMMETQERVKRNQEQSLQRLQEQLKELQDKVSEPLKPIVKLIVISLCRNKKYQQHLTISISYCK